MKRAIMSYLNSKSLNLIIEIKFFLLSILCVVCLFSCKEQVKTANYHIVYDDNIVDVKDVVSDIQFIELDTIPEAMMSRVSSVTIVKDRIYCYDSSNSGAMFVYDMNGKFLFKIQHIGKAKNEWVNLSSAFINADENRIVLTDEGVHKVLLYDLDGKYIDSKTMEPYYTNEVGYANNLYYSVIYAYMSGGLITSETNHKVRVYDESLKMLDDIIPTKITDYPMAKDSPSTLKSGSEGIILTPINDETVYLLKGESYEPYATYEYKGAHPFYSEEEINDAVKNKQWLFGDDKWSYSNLYVESPDYIIRRIGINTGVDVIYDKTKNKAVVTQFDFEFMGKYHFTDHFVYMFPECYYNQRYYGVLSTETFMAPSGYLDGYVPKELENMKEKVRHNKCNQILVSYKINLK